MTRNLWIIIGIALICTALSLSYIWNQESKVDLPGENDHLPPVVPALGTPASRSSQDKLYSPDLIVIMEEFGKEVRKYDGSRIIISGNAISRPAAYHLWHYKSWEADTRSQFMEMLGSHNPDPLDVISIHLYPASAEEGYFSGGKANLDEAEGINVSPTNGPREYMLQEIMKLNERLMQP